MVVVQIPNPVNQKIAEAKLLVAEMAVEEATKLLKSNQLKDSGIQVEFTSTGQEIYRKKKES